MKPTLRHQKTAWWRRPGGPWDPEKVGTLDDLTADDVAVAGAAGGLRAAGVQRGDAVGWRDVAPAEAATLLRACWRIGAVGVTGPGPDTDADHLVVDHVRVGPPVWWQDSAARPADVAVGLGAARGTALHTHRSLAYTARVTARAHGIGAGETLLVAEPVGSAAWLLWAVLIPALTRARAVVLRRWDPETADARIRDDQVTVLIGAAVRVEQLAARPGSLRLVVGAGGGDAAATAARLGACIAPTYGCAEAPVVTAWHDGDDPERAATTHGRPVGETEVAVAEDGELVVRSPGMFAGYRDPAANLGALAPGGWFRTGEQAVIAGGWVSVGR